MRVVRRSSPPVWAAVLFALFLPAFWCGAGVVGLKVLVFVSHVGDAARERSAGTGR